MRSYLGVTFVGLAALNACSGKFGTGRDSSADGGFPGNGGAKSSFAGGRSAAGAAGASHRATAGVAGRDSTGAQSNGGAIVLGGSWATSNGGAGLSDSSTFAGSAGTTANGGTLADGGTSANGGTLADGGTSANGGTLADGGTSANGGTLADGGTSASGGTLADGGTSASGGMLADGGTSASGGTPANGGTAASGSTMANGGTPANGGTAASGSTPANAGAGVAGGCSGPIGVFSGALADGINFVDTDGMRVNAHGGGIIKVGELFYMHGEYFAPNTTDNNFKGFSMYSSSNMATWKNEGIVLPQQASGELGPNRKGERPHIIRCPATGEFVLYAHAADATYLIDREVVYATSATVNGQYAYKGPLKNASGVIAAHSDMGAFVDGNNAYVVTESGHVYTLASDCHSWLVDAAYGALNGTSTGVESPAVFKANGIYYWIGSNKTGWRANNNFYSTAPAMNGPWTYQGYVAPVSNTGDILSDQRTWLSQSTWVQAIEGCRGTTYVYWGDHWYGNLDTSNPGRYNYLATYVFQPLVFTGTKISMPTYLPTWKLDVAAGTWSL